MSKHFVIYPKVEMLYTVYIIYCLLFKRFVLKFVFSDYFIDVVIENVINVANETILLLVISSFFT